MNYGYVRVSTNDQSIDSQKAVISRYCVDNKMLIDEWIEIEISSRKDLRQRRITELIERISERDTVLVSELSRLGRSIKEVLGIIETIVDDKKSRLVLIKQNLFIDPKNQKDMTNKILVWVFTMVAELERDFVSERTKEGLRARKAKGIKLGKPKGTIQGSMYDKDKDRIFHLYNIGVPITTIIDTHLKYGKYLSLKSYIEKRLNKEKAEQ